MNAVAAARPRSLADGAVLLAIVLGVPAAVGGLALGPEPVRLGIVALLGALVAGWVTVVHPAVTLGSFALVLALAPYAKLPGTGAPLILVLALGAWVAVAFLPGVRVRPGWPEAALLVVAVLALLSVVVTGPSVTALVEYAAWLAATSVAVPLRFLTTPARRVVVGSFVTGAAVASVVGIALLRLDPRGLLLGRLSAFGYRVGGDNAQFVPGAESNVLRLTGTYVEPNIAGLVLAVAVLLAVAAYRGWLRVLLVAVIGAGLALTLSRSALGTVVVALGLVVLLARGRQRWWLAGAGLAGGLGLLSVPVLRERLLNSFGPHDTGSLARELAFTDYASTLRGHWVWGLGWDREEFRSAAVGRTVNFVANAPLMTIYRGGLLLGLVVALVLLVLVVRALRRGRGDFETAVLSCGVAGFCLVALQLDFPVVIQHPATAVFSLLVGLALGRPAPEPGESP